MNSRAEQRKKNTTEIVYSGVDSAQDADDVFDEVRLVKTELRALKWSVNAIHWWVLAVWFAVLADIVTGVLS